MLVENKVVFVTGAASGIGNHIGKEFAKSGAKVVLSDINQEKLSKEIAQMKADGYECMGIKCDVTNEKELTDALDKTVEQYGRLDVLINNAGMQYVAAIEEFPTEKFEFINKLMVVAPFMAIKHVFPIMKQQKFGRIINMASINGIIGFAGKAAYNSAKHGLIGLTKVAALEGADSGITVNAMCPGYVDTPLVRNQFKDLARNRNVSLDKVLDEVLYPLIPQKRFIEVQEISDYTMFLASDKARGVTGQAVVLDGGYTVQ